MSRRVDFFPVDLILAEILPRLPLRHLFRCVAVSKTWKDMVRLTYERSRRDYYLYINTHQVTLYSHIPGCRVINVHLDHQLLLPECSKSQLHSIIAKPNLVLDELIVRDACNGFWLLDIDFELYAANAWPAFAYSHMPIKHGYTVLNPLTSKSLQLPTITSRSLDTFAMLVFDPRVSPRYKVIKFEYNFLRPSSMDAEVHLFSSETGRWSTLQIKQMIMRAPLPDGCVLVDLMPNMLGADATVCINGYAYRQAYCHPSIKFTAVWCFHISTEKFEYLGFPESYMEQIGNGEDCDYNKNITLSAGVGGFLHYIHQNLENISIWKIEGHGEHEDIAHDNLHWTWHRRICMTDLRCPGKQWNKMFPRRPIDGDPFESPQIFFAFHGKREVLYFIGDDGMLCCFVIEERKTLCLGSIKFGADPILVPFMCCVNDPKFLI